MPCKLICATLHQAADYFRLMGQCTSKMTCHRIDIEMLAFLFARNEAESCESGCWSSWFIDICSIVYIIHVYSCVIYSAILFERMLFPIIGTAFLTTFPGVKTRGLNKGKASGCETSSKYQYNDCHLQGTNHERSFFSSHGISIDSLYPQNTNDIWYDINCIISLLFIWYFHYFVKQWLSKKISGQHRC